MNLPILILAWKRPNHVKKVISSLRKIKPINIYVSCDGSDGINKLESSLVEETREVIQKEIDWECKINFNFSKKKLGCRFGVSNGINWFFQNVNEGIIIEDDCIIHPHFFHFAEVLLEKYKYDSRIGSISASNLQNGIKRGSSSYYFSKYHHCWGWATWKDRWKNYDQELESWKFIKTNKLERQIFGTNSEIKYWNRIFQKLYHFNKPDSWAYRWFISCQANRLISIIPNINLAQNIGFGKDGTNTIKGESPLKIDIEEISKFSMLPIKHPEFIITSSLADEYTFKNHYNPSLKTRIMNRINEKF